MVRNDQSELARLIIVLHSKQMDERTSLSKAKKSNRHGQLRKIQNEEVYVIDSEFIFFCGEELCTFAQHEGGKINWKKLM